MAKASSKTREAGRLLFLSRELNTNVALLTIWPSTSLAVAESWAVPPIVIVGVGGVTVITAITRSSMPELELLPQAARMISAAGRTSRPSLPTLTETCS